MGFPSLVGIEGLTDALGFESAMAGALSGADPFTACALIVDNRVGDGVAQLIGNIESGSDGWSIATAGTSGGLNAGWTANASKPANEAVTITRATPSAVGRAVHVTLRADAGGNLDLFVNGQLAAQAALATYVVGNQKFRIGPTAAVSDGIFMVGAGYITGQVSVAQIRDNYLASRAAGDLAARIQGPDNAPISWASYWTARSFLVESDTNAPGVVEGPWLGQGTSPLDLDRVGAVTGLELRALPGTWD